MQWKKIEGYENYSVSDNGLVKNNETEKILKQSNTSTGYKIVHLYKNKKMKNFKVHRLVAQAFAPNLQQEKCVNHINGNKHDNRIENLEWCSHSYNNTHSYRTLGRSSSNAIQAMTIAKYKAVVCVETNEKYESIKQASEKTGVCRANISKCLTKERSTAGGFHWGYAV